MKRHPIRSSNLFSVGYDDSTSILEVEFKSGSIYQYLNVPRVIYDQLLHAPSAGKFLNSYVVNHFDYRHLGNHDQSRFKKINSRINSPVPQIDFNHLYRKLAQRFHPDRKSGCEQMMKKINQFRDEGNFFELKAIAREFDIY